MLGGIREDRHQLITKTKALLLDLPTLGKFTIVVVLCCSLPIGQHLDHIEMLASRSHRRGSCRLLRPRRRTPDDACCAHSGASDHRPSLRDSPCTGLTVGARLELWGEFVEDLDLCRFGLASVVARGVVAQLLDDCDDELTDALAVKEVAGRLS
jgi:hypothetical protein